MTADDAAEWATLSALFDELSELDESALAARMSTLRAEHPQRAARLAAMLAADAAQTGVLDRSLDEVAPELHRTLRDRGWETRAGTVLGRYRLIEPIGSGGMGEVWRAERADGEYRQGVAIKLLKRGMDTQAILRRFLQERSILARLHHPGIVRLLDGGMDAQGSPYYVMEHVAGTPVTLHAKAAALDVRARVALAVKIAEAVGYAHAQLVVHRDIKPSNVLVDAAGEPHLLDFGIAKLLEISSEQTETGTGMRVLSPAYAAPEQILGEPVGTATDVYALGVLLYEMLTGQLPHRRASRNPEVLAAGIAHESTERLGDALIRSGNAQELYGMRADARRLARQVGGDLDLVVATAMHGDPQRRYPTAVAFADDLRNWLEGRPISARPDSARYRFGKFVRRHRLGVFAAAAVLLALLGGLGAALWQAGVARAAVVRADAERDVAHQQAERAERVKEFVLTLFREQDPMGRARAKARTIPELIRDGIAEVDVGLAGDPLLQAELLRDLGQIQASLGDTKAGTATLERAWKQQVDLVGADDVAAIQAQAAYAAALLDVESAKAEPLLREAVAKLAGALGRDHEKVVAAEAALVRIATLNGRHDEALALARHGLDVAERTHGKGHLQTAAGIYQIGVIEGVMGRYDDALRTFGEGLAIVERNRGAGHVRTVAFHSQMGDLLRYQRRFGEAVTHIEKALAIAREQLPPRHPMIGGVLFRLADTQRRMGRFDAAEASFAAGAEILGVDRGAHYAQLMQGYAVLASMQGQYALAIERMRISVEIFRKITGESTHTLLTELMLVDVLGAAGRLDEADRLASDTAAAVASTMTANSYEAAFSASVIGSLRFRQGRHAEALALQRHALDYLRGHYGEAHLDVAEQRLRIARTLFAADAVASAGEVDALLDLAEPVIAADGTKPSLGAEVHLLRAERALRAGDRVLARGQVAKAERLADSDHADTSELDKRIANLRRRVGVD
ncbi:serine/threonine-protein kinase [Dokdonella sp.]|uniref:serine/threonine-protein kinase n=1 Tax=Dokdonella sp. TaxID=2291710 RepID=UPI0025BA3CA8|nr:serine/threonine-protein kinase [Dokdonella sp.]MBX3690606.1 serine/threonine protein kinase [Dokdonella sp.]MCW5568154.1 serine/threonine protein kinase [Dokdonella sp.]